MDIGMCKILVPFVVPYSRFPIQIGHVALHLNWCDDPVCHGIWSYPFWDHPQRRPSEEDLRSLGPQLNCWIYVSIYIYICIIIYIHIFFENKKAKHPEYSCPSLGRDDPDFCWFPTIFIQTAVSHLSISTSSPCTILRVWALGTPTSQA